MNYLIPTRKLNPLFINKKTTGCLGNFTVLADHMIKITYSEIYFFNITRESKKL